MAGRATAIVGLLLTPALAAAAPGEVAGPPVPSPERRAPAEQAMQRYEQLAGPRRPARPCRGGDGEVVVCAPVANESSPYRLPLPEETGEALDDRRAMRANPGPPDLGRPGIAPVVRFGLKKAVKF